VTRFACPNAPLDPTGVHPGQRWENSTADPRRRSIHVVRSIDRETGDVVLYGAGEEVEVAVGALLAYWTCLDLVPRADRLRALVGDVIRGTADGVTS